MLELVRRTALLALVLGVFLRCIVGELAIGSDTPPRRPASQAPKARGLEWRFLRPIGRRLVGVQVRIILA